eukprot:3379477-Rhodomonas_salina.1
MGAPRKLPPETCGGRAVEEREQWAAEGEEGGGSRRVRLRGTRSVGEGGVEGVSGRDNGSHGV